MLRISLDSFSFHLLSQVSTHWRVAERVQRVGTTGGAERDPSEGYSPGPCDMRQMRHTGRMQDVVQHGTIVLHFVQWGGVGHRLLPIDVDMIFSL